MPGLSSSSTTKETLDSLFNGKIRMVQERDGYRFSLDALLLAGFVWLKRGEKVIDLGTGVGIIPIILGKRGEGAQEIVGVEIQENLTKLAKRNVLLNGLEDLITICHGDIRGLKDTFLPSSFDVVVTNPPYYLVSSGRINPHSQKAIARHEVKCTIDDVLWVACYLLKEGGRIFVIFPAHRSITLFNRLRGALLEPKGLRWVYPRQGEGAKFILVEAYKGGGEGVEVLPPLFVYSDKGRYTAEMEKLYSEATIEREGE
ncbi:MAG: tRNA1(Val) (adenine(37)-N6)-methyltransferase [Deltaproteobacteria bacterium]|nr:tRNA1(Val) (adenine(37)-N6)-methyltransferase [Deltaproteobacteria bacterium]